MKKVLLIGETWFVHKIHIKGFDQFTESTYGEGASWLIDALKESNFEVTHIANHKVQTDFPKTQEELEEYDIVVISDTGSNTLLLSDDVFLHSKKEPNKIEMIRQFVEKGGYFMMMGGYMAFSGINGSSRYEETELREVLPVECLGKDDRVEIPEGIVPEISKKDHDVFDGIEGDWPFFLGYNKTILKEGSEEVATINGDPFIVFGEYGVGKTAVFTSDCAPHWGPEEFVEWEYYNTFWGNLFNYLVK